MVLDSTQEPRAGTEGPCANHRHVDDTMSGAVDIRLINTPKHPAFLPAMASAVYREYLLCQIHVNRRNIWL